MSRIGMIITGMFSIFYLHAKPVISGEGYNPSHYHFNTRLYFIPGAPSWDGHLGTIHYGGIPVYKNRVLEKLKESKIVPCKNKVLTKELPEAD